VDGTQVTSGAAASYAWNSAGVVNGAHTLGVAVTDAAGGARDGRRVGVTVAKRHAAPATGTLKVSSPAVERRHLSGTSWVTLWLNGAAGASNVYTLTVAGRQSPRRPPRAPDRSRSRGARPRSPTAPRR